MARIRTIKPEFSQSESMGRISRESRLCFIQLWTLADDSGRLRAASRMLASLLYPYDNDAPELIDGWLAELERENCIVRYVTEGQHYIEIINWLSHQKIDHPSPSRFPPFARIREDSRGLENDSGKFALDQGSRKGEEGTKGEEASPSCETPKLAGVTRIEKARALWNELGLKPVARMMAMTFKPDDSSDCLRTLTAYTDEEVSEAIRNYSEILVSEMHEIKSPYQSFIGFMRGGVEKFITASDPWAMFKKRAKGFETAGEREDRERAEALERLGVQA